MFEFVESDGKGSENNIPCSSNTTVDNIQGTSVNTCFVSAEVHQVTHHQLESIEEENTETQHKKNPLEVVRIPGQIQIMIKGKGVLKLRKKMMEIVNIVKST